MFFASVGLSLGLFCERSELLIRQVYHFELGQYAECLKKNQSTPRPSEPPGYGGKTVKYTI